MAQITQLTECMDAIDEARRGWSVDSVRQWKEMTKRRSALQACRLGLPRFTAGRCRNRTSSRFLRGYPSAPVLLAINNREVQRRDGTRGDDTECATDEIEEYRKQNTQSGTTLRGMSYFVEGVRFYAPIQIASRQLPGHFSLQVPEPQRMSGSRATLQSLHGYEQISQHTAWSQSR